MPAADELESPIGATLGLLASPFNVALLELLPPVASDGAGFEEIVSSLAPGSAVKVAEHLRELESLGIVDRGGRGHSQTAAGLELIAVLAVLRDWAWSGPARAEPVLTLLGSTNLAEGLRGVWATDMLVELVLSPATTGELVTRLPGRSESSVKRLLSLGYEAGIIERGVDPLDRRRYGLTRHGMGLIRPLAAILRFERRHLADHVEAPGPRLFRAGMAVVAELTDPPGDGDREMLFEVFDAEGREIAVEHARYREGRLRRHTPSTHFEHIPWIRGTPEAWYDLIVDRDFGAMLARGKGAKRTLQRIGPAIKRASRPG